MADPVTIAILLTQVSMHIAITVRIALWDGSGYRFRPWVSRIAWLLAGSSAASAIYILLAIPYLTIERINPFNAVFTSVVLVAVLKSRGNLGRFMPRG